MKPDRNLSSFLLQSERIYYFIIDADGRYVSANTLYSSSFFIPGQDVQTQSFLTAVVSEDLTLYHQSVAKCLAYPETNVSAVLGCIKNQGKGLIIRWEFRCFSNDENAPVIQALGTDISEGKRAETEKKEIQERLVRERYLLRTLIDHLPDAIYVKDTCSRHIINNKASLDLIGADTEEETIGKTVMDYFSEESAKHLILTDQKLLNSGKLIDITEEYIITKKGEKKWLLTTKVPLKEANDEVIGLVGISRDITEKKETEESLRRSIERYNVLSRATNDAIWDWDLLDDNVFWNEAIWSMFGFIHEEIRKDKLWWENHIHPFDKKRVLKKVQLHIKEGIESWQDEYRFMCKDGTFKVVLDRGFILFDDQHKPYRMIGAMMNITERKELERELVKHNMARQRQVTEATIMGQEKERAEMGRELHDNINQILTTTKMYLDMALTEKDISEELMIKSHENISLVIEEIRILSKSLVPPSLGDIGLKEAIREMVNSLKLSQKIEIRLQTTGLNKCNIPKNVQLMVFRIIQEQMSNVLKHSKATEVEIKMVVTSDLLSMAIEDNGVGFDPKKRMKGIGLMNIVSRAEVHEGTMDIISAPGKGCTLKISIPLKTDK